MKKLLIYVMYLFCSAFNSSQKITNEDTVLIKKINDIVITFLKKNKMPIFIVSTITVLTITVILIHILKEWNKIKFDTCEFKIDELFRAPHELTESIELIKCIENIIKEDSAETALQDAQEEEEKKEKITSEDMELIHLAIKEFEAISYKKLYEEECKQNNKKYLTNKNNLSKETPHSDYKEDGSTVEKIVENSQEMLVYDHKNVIGAIEGSSFCIQKATENLLKGILSIDNTAEREFFFKKFEAGIGLLCNTKLKKIKNMRLSDFIKAARGKLKQKEVDLNDKREKNKIVEKIDEIYKKLESCNEA